MRAERLHNLTAEDWERLRSLGLVTVCDLRSTDERERHPNRIPAHLGARVLSLDMPNEMRGNPSFLVRLARQPDATGAARLMTGIYERLPGHALGPLRILFGTLLDNGVPLLIHCTAGKDRTGFMVAVVLHALGIPASRIYQDYLRSSTWPGAARHRPSLSRWLAPVIAPEQMPPVLDALLQVRAPYLDAALAAVEAEFGSQQAYLRACGLDEKKQQLLQNQLMTEDNTHPRQ
jgi:protein-tyrosine phosphatase